MMYQSKFMEDWNRKKAYLTRSVFQELPDLSTIQEQDSSASLSNYSSLSSYSPPRTRRSIYRPPSPDRYSPLPPLIIEREPNKHDEPEEFYIQFERRIKKYYRKLFYNENISVSSAGDLLTTLDVLDLNTSSFSAEDNVEKTSDHNPVNEHDNAEVFDKRLSPEEVTSENHSLNKQEPTPDNLENVDMSLTLIDDEMVDENVTAGNQSLNEQEQTPDNLENVGMSLTLIDNEMVGENINDTDASTDSYSRSTASIEDIESNYIASAEQSLSNEIQTEETESTELESQQITTIAQVHRVQDDRSPVRKLAYKTVEVGMRYEHFKNSIEDENHIIGKIINESDTNENPENMGSDLARISGPIVGDIYEVSANKQALNDDPEQSMEEEVPASDKSDIEKDDVNLDRHGVSDNTHHAKDHAEDRNTVDLDHMEEVPGDEDHVYLDRHTDKTRHLEDIDVMRNPRSLSHGSTLAANKSQTAEDSPHFDPLLSINEYRHPLHLNSSQPFDLLRFSGSENYDGNSSGRKRKTISFADESTSIKRRRGVNVETQTTADVGIQSTKYMKFNRNILNDNLFVGTPQVFKLCPCSHHVCSD